MQKFNKWGAVFVLGLAVFSAEAFAAGSRTPITSEIMGGVPVDPSDAIAASTVAIYGQTSAKAGYLCTGSIVAQDLIVSAAHCLAAPLAKMRIIFGTDINHPIKVSPVLGAVRSKAYDPRSGENDISLFKFDGQLPDGYQAVKILTDTSALANGQPTVLAGFGITTPVDNPQAGTQGSGTLRKVEVTITDAQFGDEGNEVEIATDDGKGACHGDSGGPAFVDVDGELQLYGVTSHTVDSNGSCDQGSVYTNVIDQMQFLKTAAAYLSRSN